MQKKIYYNNLINKLNKMILFNKKIKIYLMKKYKCFKKCKFLLKIKKEI